MQTAQRLFLANAGQLPSAAQPPNVLTQPSAAALNVDVVTTDFFAYDDSVNTYGLQGLGAAVEMGNAVLGMVTLGMGAAAPKWVAIRNASDPQIDAAGQTPAEVSARVAQIYERFGYWTTIPSAITCWAAIIDN